MAFAPPARSCHVTKWPEFQGYGFTLHHNKALGLQEIGEWKEAQLKLNPILSFCRKSWWKLTGCCRWFKGSGHHHRDQRHQCDEREPQADCGEDKVQRGIHQVPRSGWTVQGRKYFWPFRLHALDSIIVGAGAWADSIFNFKISSTYYWP